MAVGLPTAKADIDSVAGNLARQLNVVLADIATIKVWLDAQLDADLIALGYTSGEVASLKSAFTDLNQLQTIYTGAANLSVAKDFRAFAKRIYGFGV